jgi:hypothetical protein
MARTFKRRRDGRLVVTLPEEAVLVLRQVTDDLGQMVAAREPGPVTDRMFPRAYLDPTEEEAEHEWEELVHDDLSRSRTEALEGLLADLDAAERSKGDRMQMVLEKDGEARWLTALNDARLALGTLIGVSEDEGPEYPDDDPRAAGAQIYVFLTALLGDLVEVLLDEAPEDGVD